MQITATDKPLRVDYRVAGKTYNQSAEPSGPYNNDTASTYPFDSADLQPGETLNVSGGTKVIRIVETGGIAIVETETPA